MFTRRTRRAVALQCEALEDRCGPSTLTFHAAGALVIHGGVHHARSPQAHARHGHDTFTRGTGSDTVTVSTLGNGTFTVDEVGHGLLSGPTVILH
jgi:hypothetical protein